MRNLNSAISFSRMFALISFVVHMGQSQRLLNDTCLNLSKNFKPPGSFSGSSVLYAIPGTCITTSTAYYNLKCSIGHLFIYFDQPP